MKRMGIALGCAALLGLSGRAESTVEGLEAKIAAAFQKFLVERLGFAAKTRLIGPWAALEPKDRRWTPMPQMPINYTETIAKAGIPVFLVYGGQDQTVDPTLNSQPFIGRFKKAGGNLTVDARPFCGHHPHGFDYENRRTILDFLMAK